jgi:hypothetical protein
MSSGSAKCLCSSVPKGPCPLGGRHRANSAPSVRVSTILEAVATTSLQGRNGPRDATTPSSPLVYRYLLDGKGPERDRIAKGIARVRRDAEATYEF